MGLFELGESRLVLGPEQTKGFLGTKGLLREGGGGSS